MLFIDRRGAELSINQGRLKVVSKAQDLNTSIPLRQLEALVISCDCQLSSSMLRSLSQHQISFICLHPWDIHSSMVSVPCRQGNIQRRINQYSTQQIPSLLTAIARMVVRLKIYSQKQTLLELSYERPDLRTELMRGYAHISMIHQSIHKAGTVDYLMGKEGAAARSYFQAYSQAFPESLEFTKRQKRPPKDPVNAVLSLSYTLLYFEAIRACYSSGLDPSLGVLHQPTYSRASLACDLAELLRHKIDVWVWGLFRHRTLRSDHFTKNKDGSVRLTKLGRQLFFENYMVAFPQWRDKLRILAMRWAKYIDGFSLEQGVA